MTAALRLIGRRSAKRQPRPARRAAAFRLMYERFREILALNDGTLDLIADMQDRLSGQRGFSLDAIGRRARKAAMDVFVMVKNLNQIAEDQHSSLYGALRRISDRLESECASIRGAVGGPMVLPLAGVHARDAPLVGTKMANLGEIATECGLPVPAGFVITTSAFPRFMEEGELWEKCERLETILELDSPEAFAEACHEVQSGILATPIPAELAASIRQAYGDHFRGEESRVAVRSSAVGEDTASILPRRTVPDRAERPGGAAFGCLPSGRSQRLLADRCVLPLRPRPRRSRLAYGSGMRADDRREVCRDYLLANAR